MDDEHTEELRTAWHTCRELQRELEAQLRELHRTETQLAADLAPRLCGIPLGSLFEIPKGRYQQGRWRVTGYDLDEHKCVEIRATKLKNDGADSQTTNKRFWESEWKRYTFTAPAQEDQS